MAKRPSRTETIEIQSASTGNLRSLLLNGSQPTILIGAGASVTSGIPAAELTAEKAARHAWCRAHARSPEDMRVLRSDYWPWLCGQPWFSEAIPLATQYPLIIEKLLGVKRDRRDFFERLISPGISPNVGYRSLVRILNEGWITTVLTTNFDHCLQESKVLENKPHLLVSIRTPDDLVRLSSSPRDPQLVYLHGSVEHYSDRNLLDEVSDLHPDFLERLVPLLQDHPLIVVGYRGAEPSIMKRLLQDHCDRTTNFVHGVYWCVRESDITEPLSPMVAEFARSIGSNFQLVPIKGFDQLMEYDLWNQLLAEGALPIRQHGGFAPVEAPADMKAALGGTLDGLDSRLLFSRLTQYAKRLGLWAPASHDDEWIDREVYARHLAVKPEGVEPVPTLAGWLLFARAPHELAPHAVVRFVAKGPSQWIAQSFGEDAAAGDPDDHGNIIVEQDIRGTLWAQLDSLTDLIALVNRGFRLKEEVSRTAYPYDPVAIKEVLVNALVHRDYERAEAIHVTVEPGSLEVKSPGGLIAEVAAQTRGGDIQEVIAGGRRGIKGYRNPVVSDLFYGGGQMDRAGSGLADVWLQTANNNGDATFGPDYLNAYFVVRITPRPEAVNLITNTATPLDVDTDRYAANLLPIESLPQYIWHTGTSAGYTGALMKDATGLTVPRGHVHDGRFFSFYDLEQVAEAYVTPFDPGDIERLNLLDVLGLPNGENIVLKLMNEAMFEHLRALGLFIEYRRRRTYFPKSNEGERKVTYRGRVKRATRTVVKARVRRDSAEVLYYEHKAMTFSILRFGDDWALAIAPGYSFTRDGKGKPLGRDRVNALSTRRAARDFNPTVHHDVTFWAATLSNESEGLFALRCGEEDGLTNFAPTILLSNRLPTVSISTASFETSRERDGEIEADLEELEDELEALADEERLLEERQSRDGNDSQDDGGPNDD